MSIQIVAECENKKSNPYPCCVESQSALFFKHQPRTCSLQQPRIQVQKSTMKNFKIEFKPGNNQGFRILKQRNVMKRYSALFLGHSFNK